MTHPLQLKSKGKDQVIGVRELYGWGEKGLERLEHVLWPYKSCSEEIHSTSFHSISTSGGIIRRKFDVLKEDHHDYEMNCKH